MKRLLDEGVTSWAYFRVLEALNRTPPDVEAAKAYALSGVRYLAKGEIPEGYAA